MREEASKNYEDDDCLTLLQRYTNYFITNGDTIIEMFHNSGKDYNDFGRFTNCEANTNFNYLLANVHSKQLPIPMSMGLCMPTVCKEADLNELKPYILPIVNNQLPYIMDEIKGFNLTHFQISDTEVRLANSLDLNAKYSTFSFQHFLFIIVTLFLVTFSASASIIAH